MHRFWAAVTEPLLDAVDATVVAEVGVDAGDTTRLLLSRAQAMGAGTVHAIDPAPDNTLDVDRLKAEHGARLCFHQRRSHAALAELPSVDAALIDGDHNWFTVSGELRLLAQAAAAAGEPLPLVLAHDVRWPYGRRDMYYDLASVPEESRHPAARLGLLPGKQELDSSGVNPWLWNATHEGGPRNGVLTAIEDFVADYDEPCELVVVEGFHGLGVLASRSRLEAAPRLRAALDRLRSVEFGREWAAEIDRARLHSDIAGWWATGAPGPSGRDWAQRDTGDMKLSVVVPARDEAGAIERTLEGIEEELGRHSIDYEIVVVDDGSTDGTAAVADRVAARDERVRCIPSPYPSGFGYTVRAGLDVFTGDAVAVMMADGSDDPADLVVYHRTLEAGYDCAFGSRFMPGATVTGYPRLKLAINRIVNFGIRMLFRHGYNDTTNAFKAYRRDVIEQIGPLLSPHFNLTVELPLKAVVRGFSYAIVPTSWRGRTIGQSRLALQEMGSRYLFIVLYVFLEHHLSRGDYRVDGATRQRVEARVQQRRYDAGSTARRDVDPGVQTWA